MNIKTIGAVILALACHACASKVTDAPVEPVAEAQPQLSILELMNTIIVPATNTLWGIDEPQTDEEWQAFMSVADETIAAFEQTRNGGSGPQDADWAADPRWAAYANEAISAGEQFKVAIQAQDMEAIWTAGDALLAPCTACHNDFNPAVIAE
jgi:cytochrome c556